MMREKFPAHLSPEDHRKEASHLQVDPVNRNRLITALTVLAMLLIAAHFGYRLQIGPTGHTIERSESNDQPKTLAHTF